MHLRIVLALVTLVGLIGCEKPCKTGYQRYGVKCVRSPEMDAGIDAGTESDAGSSGMKTDAGRQTAEPSLDAGLVDASDATTTSPDAGEPAPPCYLDKDGDGVGAGEPRRCSDAGDAGVGTLVSTTGDCDDEDGQRSPSLSDVCGDQIDNDCDGKVDDEANNACGGACTTQLGNQPGEVCTNGLLGGCERKSTYKCSGPSSVACDAPTVPASDEVCNDNVDNDCDGYVNEIGAVDGQIWYRDCDGDGYAASTMGFLKACTKPPVDASCSGGWTVREPVGPDVDCNGNSARYYPGAYFGVPPAGSTSADLNCDGVIEKEPYIYYDPDGSFMPLFPLCNPETCNCGYWHDATGKNTRTQPSCSLGPTDTRKASLTALATCAYFTVDALQRCR